METVYKRGKIMIYNLLWSFICPKNKEKEKNNEKDLSAQEKTEEQSSRFQKENVHNRRKKRFKEKKKQGQKEAVCISGDRGEIPKN